MRVVGIDQSIDRLRAVEAEVSFGRIDIRGYHDADSVEELRAKLPAKIDRLVVGMPPGTTTFRSLPLPTRDRRAIRSAVQFELEDELPFEGGDVAHDFSVLSQTKTSSLVFFEACRIPLAQERLDAFTGHGLDPDILTSDTWAYRTLLTRALGEGDRERCALLVHLGESASSLYIQSAAAPRVLRHTSWGTRRWIEGLSGKYGLPTEQARTTLRDNGFVLTAQERAGASGDQKDFSKVIEDGVRELLFEIRQLQLTCKRIAGVTPELVFLSGTSSRLQGLKEFLNEELKLPTEHLKPLAATASTAGHFNEASESTFALAAGFTLIGAAVDKVRAPNLRRLALPKGGNVQFDVRKYRRGIALTTAVLVSLVMSVWFQSSIYTARISKLNDRLELGIKSFFGYTSKNQSRAFMSDLPKLKTAVEKELSHQREIAKLINQEGDSPLKALRGLSARIPKSIVVDLTELKIGAAPSAPMRLVFLVANPQVAESLNRELTPYLDDLKREGAEEVEAPEGGRKLRVTFLGRAKGKLYE